MNRKTQWNIKKMTITALAIAVVCVGTTVIQIPIPFGYMHFGNCLILLAGVYLGSVSGLLAGGLGSALADLLTYPQWAIPTLIIKGLMGWAIGFIAGRNKKLTKLKSVFTVFANLAGIGIMIGGYYLAGVILYGGWAASAAQLPGLIAEGLAGILLFYIVAGALEAAHVPGLLQKNRSL
jgi:Predicted membrane protein